MKKLFITGGSSGIGLEITKQFSEYEITNFDASNGDDVTLDKTIENIINSVKDNKPKYLFLNAGIGIFGKVGEINDKMISKVFDVNVIPNMRIINGILDVIKADDTKVVVTLSTASYINGAFESVYNSSKKALESFVVSTNTELIDAGSKNRIFSFVPHFVPGTGLTGGDGNGGLSEMITLLKNSITSGENAFIPKYNEVYKAVFDDYKNDPIGQGIKSIEYKKSKGKI